MGTVGPFAWRHSKTCQANPDPKRFVVRDVVQVGRYAIAKIHYPGCTTYEGMKISVYAAAADEVASAHTLDPHFTDDSGLHPIARFPATDDGMAMAVLLCEAMMQTCAVRHEDLDDAGETTR